MKNPSSAPTSYRQARFSLPEGATEIVLVRHGETIAANPADPFPLIGGHGDPELAAEGRQQAIRVAERLAGERVDAIYVTNLRRTHETAAPLAEALGLEPIEEADLREILLGEWEGGLYRRHVSEGHPIALQMMEQERWDVIPGAESNDAFSSRIRRAIDRIAGDHPTGRVVAVVHGGVIGMIMSLASGSRPFAFIGADNGSISSIVVMEGNWAVRSFNDVSHLNSGGAALASQP